MSPRFCSLCLAAHAEEKGTGETMQSLLGQTLFGRRWNRKMLVPISCVVLGMSPNLSESEFLQCKMGIIIKPMSHTSASEKDDGCGPSAQCLAQSQSLVPVKRNHYCLCIDFSGILGQEGWVWR